MAVTVVVVESISVAVTVERAVSVVVVKAVSETVLVDTVLDIVVVEMVLTTTAVETVRVEAGATNVLVAVGTGYLEEQNDWAGGYAEISAAIAAIAPVH